MIIQRADTSHLDGWATLRALLWPDASPEAHRAELAQLLSVRETRIVAFIALSCADEIIGFAEASLRSDYVNGCETSPVTFLEGIFIGSGRRRTGVARALCLAVEHWGRAAGSREMASDADIGNVLSQAFHAALGFQETERVVFFRKPL